MKVSIAIAAAAFVSTACSDNTPARIEIAQPTAVILDENPTSIGARLLTKAGAEVKAAALTYSVAPARVLTVAANGLITCRSSGDASVIVAGGGQSAAASILCRLVTTIEAPDSVQLVLGNRGAPLRVAVRDRDGQVLSDVPLTTMTPTPGVARYVNGALVPVGVGRTTLVLSAGKATATTQVDVVQLVESTPLALADGAARVFTLSQGTYDVDIKVQTTNGSAYGVTVSWVGADCPAMKESQKHRIRCQVPETASMTILNPTAFGLGPAETGFVNIYRTAQ